MGRASGSGLFGVQGFGVLGLGVYDEDLGFRASCVSGSGFGSLGFTLVFTTRINGLGLGLIGSGFGLRVAWGSGFRGFGFWVLRPGSRVQGFLRSGFGVWGFGV